ncbi:MAG: RluA family pseudouridine synthase [Parachlamydiaceae bacterium]
MAIYKVTKCESGLSLQAFLRKLVSPDVSAKQIKRAIDAGKCMLNGRTERFATRFVGLGDSVEIAEFVPKEKPAANDIQQILYVDADIIAYNKPSGISSDAESMTASLTKQFGPVILLHRLDKGTSGVLLFARHEKMAAALEALFKKRLVAKTYYAIVEGVPTSPKGRVDNFLGKLCTYEGQSLWGSVPQEKGLPAATAWERQSVGDGVALLVCHPETGRTHQIRVHLSEMGHPILGDHQYCRSFVCPYVVPRVMLHAAEVQFVHPGTRKLVCITAVMPSDFEKVLKDLRFNG